MAEIPQALSSIGSNQPGLLRRHMGKLILFLVVLPVLLCAAYVALTLSFTFSEGDRVGYLQKFAARGWLCKTWEGELAMSTVPGVAPQIFAFTVRDELVAQTINQLQGQRVALYYEQKKGIPSSCFGDTEYFVVSARPVK